MATKIGEDRFAAIENAVREQCEVILIATPPTAIFEIIEQLGDVTGKVIIDATNSVMNYPEPYKTVYHCLAKRNQS